MRSPESIKNFCTLSCPCCKATANGVNPSSVARDWLAPDARRNRTTPSWFSCAAMYSGVKPFCDCTLTDAPLSTRIRTTSSCGNRRIVDHCAGENFRKKIIQSRGLCYKTLWIRNYGIFVLSWAIYEVTNICFLKQKWIHLCLLAVMTDPLSFID